MNRKNFKYEDLMEFKINPKEDGSFNIVSKSLNSVVSLTIAPRDFYEKVKDKNLENLRGSLDVSGTAVFDTYSESYGEDRDGNRGENRNYIDKLTVEFDELKMFILDENGDEVLGDGYYIDLLSHGVPFHSDSSDLGDSVREKVEQDINDGKISLD